MYCASCRTQNTDAARWCTSCGADLEAQRTPSGLMPSQGTVGGSPTQMPQEATAVLHVGQCVGPEGRYEIQEELGRGGMGVAYRAVDQLADEVVAVKVMMPWLLSSEAARKRFSAEATLARKLTHPNIVRVHGPDTHAGLQLLVMECLDGRTLRSELLARKDTGEEMPVERAAEISQQCCAALSHAHAQGVLHRDVKPENVFLEEAPGGELSVKLLDFGIARAMDPSQWSSTNLAQGTAGYVAPEVLQGGEPSERSDLYSLGVILYECLTGVLPVGRFDDPSQVRPGLAPDWDDLLGSMLSSHVERRPAGGAAVAKCLRELERAPVAAPVGREEPPAPRPGHSTVPALLALGALAIAVTAWQLWPDGVETPAPLESAEPTKVAEQAIEPARAEDEAPQPAEAGEREAIVPPDRSRPKLFATDPVDGATVPGGPFELRGSVREADLASAALEGRPCVVEPDGRSFRCNLVLESGRRQLTLRLLDAAGNESGEELRFTVEPTAEELLAQADALRDDTKLTLGDPNARELYRAVQSREPGNARARAGLESIRAYFLQEAARHQEAGEWSAAEASLGKARETLHDSEVASAAESLAAARQSAEEAARRETAPQRSAATEEVKSEPGPPREPAAQSAPEEAARGEEERSRPESPRDRLSALGLRPAGTNASGHEVYERKADGARMILVPGGSFRMGSNEGNDDEKPVHGVELSSYLLDETEVTWEQYVSKRPPPERPSWHPGGRHPVVNVSWEDASAYCASVGMKLPTEAQWEYAARGPRSLRYPWGESWDERKANWSDEGFWGFKLGKKDGHEYTAPVRSFPSGAGPFGHLDLAGNVWEWVNDWYAYASRVGGVRDPAGPRSGTRRVLRGGSFNVVNYSIFLRGDYRHYDIPSARCNAYGFRCAQDVP